MNDLKKRAEEILRRESHKKPKDGKDKTHDSPNPENADQKSEN